MKSRSMQSVAIPGCLWLCFFGSVVLATEPTAAVREGLRLYSKEQYEEARTQFAAASEELDKRKSSAAAIAAFDEACAAHRKGDPEHARESYLRAGLSQDRSIAVAAHFNLGMLAAEKAKTLSGEKPELVAADKRQEILDQLSQAIAAYRHCLELQSDHAPSRRNIELMRQWIKYYTDKWHERDLQKRRDESNLLTFLEFLIQTQTALKESVSHLPEPVRSDTFAELKRAQEELQEEIPTLREKIDSELRPPPDPQSGNANAAPKELDEGIKLLQSWADTAGGKMSAASRRLGAKEASKAIADQLAALDELDRIWEGVIPFHPLLAKDLADQTIIAKTLAPIPAEQTDGNNSFGNTDDEKIPRAKDDEPENATSSEPRRGSQQLDLAEDDLRKLEEIQSRTLKRTQLLAPKAESELNQMENAPAATVSEDDKSNAAEPNAGQTAVDPEQVKAGYRKAIELAPQAVEKMEAAIKSMKQKDHQTAAQRSEEARQILDEIQQAQPKNEQKQDQNKDDQEKNDDQKKQDNKQGDDQKKDDEKKSDEQKPEPNKPEKDENGEKDENKNEKSQQPEKQQSQVSKDRLEDALRKVRERQQEKRERDRKLKGLFLGKIPVDKDW